MLKIIAFITKRLYAEIRLCNTAYKTNWPIQLLDNFDKL